MSDREKTLEKVPGWKEFKNDSKLIQFKSVEPAQALSQVVSGKPVEQVLVTCPTCGKKQKRRGKYFFCDCG